MRFSTFATLVALATLIASPLASRAADEAAEEAGSPARIELFPQSIQLTGVRQQMQLVVTGFYEDGTVRDLTRLAEYTTADGQVAEVEGSVVRPRADGGTQITATVAGQSASATVEVRGQQQPDPVSFVNGALAALSKQGCNAGACHGSPSGKGGFRLSLRAFDPELDKLTLIREDFGRRTNPLDPDASLLLAKPLMKVPHGGGRQMTSQDAAYEVLRDWIAEGCRLDAAEQPHCVRLEVFPPSGRVLQRPAQRQQLCVLAHFSDGSIRDVTPLAVFTSSDTEVATVDAHGLVDGLDRGETAIVVRYLEFIETTSLTFVRDIPGYVWNDPPVNNYIDQHVHRKLQQLKYLPSETCTDDEFLRRVYLDVIGLLPTVDQTREFLADQAPDKRARAIDSLLERPEFAKFWALKWGDLLRLTSSQVGPDGVYKYHRWLEQSLRDNVPYDQFARQLLTSVGSTLDNPPANFYRTAVDTNDCVETVSQVFLGARLQCAKCHNHPFERWTQDNYYGMAAFFNRVQRQKTRRDGELFIFAVAGGEVTQPRTGKQMKPWLPQQGELSEVVAGDRRQLFADWLTRPDNPYFARIEVNRIWSQLLGRGIVEPADDFRDSNPPCNAELLDALAEDFVQHGFDRRHIVRIILNSRTYQASFRPNEFNESDEKYFSHYRPRMLSAEQLLDAICQATGVDEPLGPLPAGTKATQLPAPDLVKHEFLKTFGQPERQTVCACERSSESNLGMAIQFFNGSLLYNKLRDANNRFRKLIAEGKTDDEIIGQMYLAAVCRLPSEEELQAARAHLQSKPDRLEGLEDVNWAVINTNEFLFQH
ncbi:MAG: DUF1549 domain-containing protein [Pirellulaceae bacterium]|nr:DUF1549 domain-containing protein [Pirellulaceae bacterium]